MKRVHSGKTSWEVQTRFNWPTRSIALTLTLSLIITLASLPAKAQTSNSKRESQSANTSEAIRVELQKAEQSGVTIEGVVKLSTPLNADVLQGVSIEGELESVLIVSTTTMWFGAIFRTPREPLTSLSEAVRTYERMYRQSGPGDRSAVFAVSGFKLRGSAGVISSASRRLPDASIVGVSAENKTAASENAQTPDPKKPERDQTTLGVAEKLCPTHDDPSPLYVPTQAQLTVQRLANSDRRVDVSFSWNSPDALAGLTNDRAALEIQVLFWNHANNPKNSNVTFIGAKKTWGASFPNGYFDTPALNASGFAGSPIEREVTIGSFDARSDFRAGQQYNVWAILEKGALDANFAKLSFQRGLYNPTVLEDHCLASWCAAHILSGEPAHCVLGLHTTILTPRNYTGKAFSIVAPVIPPFDYPNAQCTIPPGYPADINLDKVSEQQAAVLASQILPFQDAFLRNGGKTDLGCPSNNAHKDLGWWPQGGLTQDFRGSQSGKGDGALLLPPSSPTAYWVHGAIWNRYRNLSPAGPNSVVGEPTGDEQSAMSSKGTSGAQQSFKRGWMYFNSARNQVFYVVNAIAAKYNSVGRHSDALGFPISDEYSWNGGARTDFEGGHIYWNPTEGAVIVRGSSSPLPTIGNYNWDRTPTDGQPFNGFISGTNFVVNGTSVFFCINGTNTCFQHPAAGVNVTGTSNINLSNVNLSAGSWQIYVRTAAGQSTKSSAFNVQAPPQLPTIGNYGWDRTPTGGQPFNGFISGTNFVVNGTSVFFCINGTNTCFQHPAAGVNVTSTSNINLSNVNLSAGSWQIYVRTAAGQSARSSIFTVR